MKGSQSYLIILLILAASTWMACTPAAAGLMPPPSPTIELIEEIPLPLETVQPGEINPIEPTLQADILSEATATETEMPTATSTATAIPTHQVPLAELQETPTVPPESLEQAATQDVLPTDCYRAELVEDVTLLNRATVSAGDRLVQTWRVRNVGSCTWTFGYTLVFIDGEIMDASDAGFPIDEVQPGATVDFSISVVAPTAPGNHVGNWKLLFENSEIVGMGDDGQAPLRLELNVEAAAQTSFEFTRDFCAAAWSSQLTYGLECPTSGLPGSIGWVGIDLQPILEDGRAENEPALVVYPSEGSGGFISGFYPAIRIEQGDRFQAVIGCLQGFNRCNVVFQLNFYTLADSATRSLGSWNEIFNEEITHVDVNLSGLAGQDVVFQLLVLSNGDSSDDRAFWLSPRVAR